MNENSAARLKKAVLRVAYWIGLFLAMAVICMPGLWIVLSSLRPTVEIMAKPPVWIPTELSFDAYVAMFSGIGQGGIPVVRYFMNSLIISVTSTVIALVIGMSGGYAFARYRFEGKSGWFLGLMLTRTVPGIALSLPLFFVYARLGIIDTHFGLILAYVALNIPFTIWLIDGFFRQVPRDLAEAAQIDGCTRWQAFWQVEFPLAGPGIASAGSSPSSPRGTSSRWLPSSHVRSTPRRFRSACSITRPSSPSTGAACAHWRSS